MQIQSSVIKQGNKIPQKYTCDGENLSPPLEFIGVPKNTKSLVLICDDPDAPMGTWIHWVVFNINPRTRNVAENSVPQGGIEGVTSFGSKKYGGPCPPSGEHRYFFKLFALKEKLDLKSDATMSEIEKAIEENLIAQAELMGVYERSEE
jgi:hypothetical protein